MKPSEALEASEYVSDIIDALEDIHPEAEDVDPGFRDTVPGRKAHIMQGSRKILELYGEAVDRPVRDPEGNIRFEYAMGSIYANLDSYNGDWDFEEEELRSLHKAYRYLFLKSDFSPETGYNPAEYSGAEGKQEHAEGLLDVLEVFWENRESLASSVEEVS